MLPVDSSFLFARLTHPSGMVRERTCVAIARLLNQSGMREPVEQHLQIWLASQKLESVAIFALLVWIRARIENPGISLPPLSTMTTTFPKPSVLSWMLLKEIYGQSVPTPDWSKVSSDDAPPDFCSDRFFHKYVENFLPPAYLIVAQGVERRTGVPFIGQWAWEWHRLHESIGLKPNSDVLREWGYSESGHYMAIDFALSEVYRSAYLRTLAWTVEYNKLSQDDVQNLAIKTCPVDIALWQYNPGHRPEWWPSIACSDSKIDNTAAQLSQCLGSLWKKGSPDQEAWVIAEASGLALGGNVPLDLEIYGVFQRCEGPDSPDMKEVLEWCRWGFEQRIDHDSLLRFTGDLMPVGLSGFQRRFDDWVIVPAASIARIQTVARWQWWREKRNIWSPASFLWNSPLHSLVTDAGIDYSDGQNVIAKWIDWTDGLAEMQPANLPPATGQCLFIKRHAIDHFATSTRSRFCWLWRLTGFQRQYDHLEFETFSLEGEYGAAKVVRV